ncbi:MAG: hypothetical protein CUR32_06640 [Flavobacterium sp.]|nr:MAG: hypothetical protein CUR32_06640 [Flavobacterium sp.] [Flavobacterium sp. FEMGT703F]
MSSEKVKRISLKYQIVTIVLAVGSAIILFVPIKQFKQFKTAASYLLSASAVTFITTRHSMRDVLDEVEKLESLHTDNTRLLEKQIVTLTDDKGDLNNQIGVLMGEIEALKFDASEQLAELQTCQKSLREVFDFNKETAHRLVEECYQVGMKKCVCHVESLYRNYAECRTQLDDIKLEIEAKKERFSDKLTAYNSITSFDELIDVGLELQEIIITQTIELRCKAQSVVINQLLKITTDAVPYPDFESYIESFKYAAGERIEQTEEKRKSDLQAIAQEFTVLVESHKQRYVGDVNEAIDTAKLAVQQLEVSRYELQDALRKLDECKKPLQFSGASSFAMMANSVSDYYYKRYHFLLDALHWEETETGFKCIYSIRRNPGLIESEISADNSLEQTAAFCNALHGTEPKWEFNRQFSQLSLTVTHRRTVKLKNELPRGVRTADKFLSTVKNWRRVRITGGSESGKSPTAENLVCALTTLHDGICDFYDPMFDSVKNYRSIPAVGKSHADSVKGLKDYQAKMQAMPSDKFYLAWFDEIDTTLDENPKSSSDLKAVLKQSSHKNSGLIITGQNANVRNLKGGFDRSDMNNFVCVHIGDNYRDAIANSHLSESEKANSMKTGDALTDYCAFKNDEDGLDHTDPSAYRFALVLEPNKKPYFMILPEFGEYVWQDPTEAIDTDEPIDTNTAPIMPVSQKNPNCPICESESKKNGFLKTEGEKVQRYKCKNSECRHEFS